MLQNIHFYPVLCKVIHFHILPSHNIHFQNPSRPPPPKKNPLSKKSIVGHHYILISKLFLCWIFHLLLPLYCNNLFKLPFLTKNDYWSIPFYYIVLLVRFVLMIHSQSTQNHTQCVDTSHYCITVHCYWWICTPHHWLQVKYMWPG